MRNKQYTAIPILLVLALLITGFAYAHWSENLYISGTVYTGELDWRFTGTSSIDPDGVNDYHCNDGFTGTPQFWQGDKNVGYTSVSITDPHTVTMVMHNVYPCYFVSISIYAQNTGTIPLIFEKVIIDGHEIFGDHAPIIRLDLNGDTKDDIEIWWKNGIGNQLHPGDYTNEMSLWFHILQDAPEGETHTFTIELVAINWNAH